MRAVDLLRAVRDGEPIKADAVRDFVRALTQGEIPDYQVAAFAMAVFFRGMSDELTVALTLAMRDSGRVIDLSDVPGLKVDKHSTGGVGDKISLPLAPLVAACGVPVPMVSGRGLGHTGGTLDKLESIPGFRVDLPIERFRAQVKQLGCCLIGQTADLAPADKKLYALRDVTATVESIPLITSSILSKKLAEGINALVLDVKVGRGAFMKDEASARRLAESLVRVGTGAGVKTRALLTRMEEPLGTTIGNALEVRESLDILRGKGPADSTELTMSLAVEMLIMGGASKSEREARQKLKGAIDSGKAIDKFRQIVEAQGGDPRVIDDPHKLPKARSVTEVKATKAGVVASIDSYALGTAAMRLGAGRAQASDPVDPAVGLELRARLGDELRQGDVIVLVHHNRDLGDTTDAVRAAYHLGDTAPPARPLIIDRIDSSEAGA